MPKNVLLALTLAPNLALALALTLEVQFWAWKLSVFNGLWWWTFLLEAELH